MQEVLLVVAFGFAVACGLNDGAAVLAAGLRVRGITPWVAVVALGAAVVVAPLVLGTAVATTLASDLVSFDGEGGRRALLVAVATATGVTALLTKRGLPTSLTLALIGALTGAGLGAGFDVSVGTVGFVLLMGVLAPLVGLAGGWMLTVAVAGAPSSSPLRRRVPRWHLAGFGLQCLAYGANDGQKMLAVVAVAVGSTASSGGAVEVPVPSLLLLGALFMVGTVLGLGSVGATLAGGVAPIQPAAAVITEVSSATVVLGSSAIGAPVSMTQAISGAMVGTEVQGGHGRIRWQQVARLAVAWVLTLPAALAVAAGVAAVWA
nr:inorganic phosphate transporter [Salsipaludibacter albus]